MCSLALWPPAVHILPSWVWVFPLQSSSEARLYLTAAPPDLGQGPYNALDIQSHPMSHFLPVCVLLRCQHGLLPPALLFLVFISAEHSSAFSEN